jgi:predicted nicotinamide N-methyase
VPEVQLYLADEMMAIWRQLEEERGERGVPPPFWAFAWPGGLAVARYILDNPHEVAGKRVMDFASGSGLCAIAALKAGAAHVIAADIDALSGAAVTLNAGANGVDVTFSSRDPLQTDLPSVDIILAGDTCYEKQMARDVLAWLRSAHAQGIRVLIGDPGRPYFRREGLIQVAEYLVPTTRDLEDREFKRTGVFTYALSTNVTIPAISSRMSATVGPKMPGRSTGAR